MKPWAQVLLGVLAVPATANAVTYPEGARHSPMTREIVARQKAVVSRGKELGARPDVFAKIGDSITVHQGFLHCFAEARDADLGDHEALLPTISFFGKTTADGDHVSFARKSKAAGVGWSTFGALGHARHSPLHIELGRTKPAFAVVMLGTNETYGGGVPNYQRNLRRVVQEILADGVLPIVSTIPPRRDSRDLDAIVVEMNRVVREIAESEVVPFVDYGGELRKLPGFGLGPDGIHPVAHAKRPCDLRDEGLAGGVNVRNLVTLEALDRVRRFVVEDQTPEGE